MAQTKQYWQSKIDTEVNTLLGLSTSASAEWKIWRDAIVSVVMILEAIVDAFKDDTLDYVDNQRYGTKSWYKSICKEFQYPGSLSVKDGRVGYAAVDPTKQIIAAASVRDQAKDGLVVKLAKSSNGNLVPLSSAELTSFRSYFNARKILGTVSQIFSMTADSIYYDVIIEYDPLYGSSQVQAAVEDLLLNYRDNYEFDGLFYRADLIKQIMEVPGVVNLHFEDLEITHPSGDLEVISNMVELDSGYFVYDSNCNIEMVQA